MRAQFVEHVLPRENDAAAFDDKDRSGIQNSALEVFAIAVHLMTLQAHGVTGPFLEFGCFKGFSTAILSDACHQLGIPMHVFDSFAGAPTDRLHVLPRGRVRRFVARGACATSPPTDDRSRWRSTRASSPTPSGGFAEPTFMCMWMDVDLESVE